MAVIVGVDGSEQSRRVLEWAVEEARLRGEDVVALLVYSQPPTYYPMGAPGTGDAQLIERIRSGAQEHLSSVVEAARASADGVKIDGEVVERDQPAQALVERAGPGDLLVVGARGLGGFRGLLLGSVSQQCVQHARCPTIVVPPGALAAS